MTFTTRDMRAQITIALTDHAGDYDTDAIIEDIQEQYGTVDIDTIEANQFWAIVRPPRHHRPRMTTPVDAENPLRSAERKHLLGMLACKLEGKLKSLDITYGLVAANQHGRPAVSDCAAFLWSLHLNPADPYQDPAKVTLIHSVLTELAEGHHITAAEYQAAW